MAKEETISIEKLLDDMALKIMMVEPGNLSVVGELVVLVESLETVLGPGDYPKLQKMAYGLREAFGQIVMTELADSQENFDLLGECIGLMQEMYRKKDDDPEGEKAFENLLQSLQNARQSRSRQCRISSRGAGSTSPSRHGDRQSRLYHFG